MHSEQIILFKDSNGRYIPYDTINEEVCVLLGSKEEVLDRLKKTLGEFYKIEAVRFINSDTIIVKVNNKYILSDIKGRIIGDLVDDFIILGEKELDSDLIGYEFNGKYGFMNIRTGETIETHWERIGTFSEGLAAVKDPITHKWGYVNEKMELMIECKFDVAEHFSDSMAVVGKKIDREKDFSNSEICLNTEDRELIDYIWFEDNKAVYPRGYIDKTGKLVIPYSYFLADNFHEGMALTKTYVEDRKHNFGGAFITKDNKRSRYLESIPYDYYNGLALMRVDGGHYGQDRFYAIDKKFRVKEISIDEYFVLDGKRHMAKFDMYKQRDYEIRYAGIPRGRKKLVNDRTIVEIDIYNYIKNKIDDFYNNRVPDENIYAYNITSNEIIPLPDFVVGCRNVLTVEEAKPYVRKRIK